MEDNSGCGCFIVIVIVLFAILLLVAFDVDFIPRSVDVSEIVNPKNTSGFISGIIHGCLAWLSLIISIFSDNYSVYAINNSGWWYNFGYLLGCGGIIGGGVRLFSSK